MRNARRAAAHLGTERDEIERARMPRRLLLGLAVLLLAAASLACASLGGTRTLPVGDEAPNFGIKVDGRTTTLHDYGGYVPIICFWSST